jgi:hypothetical protein
VAPIRPSEEVSTTRLRSMKPFLKESVKVDSAFFVKEAVSIWVCPHRLRWA